MLIKNKIIIIFVCLLSLNIINTKLFADEFNISASEITIDKQNDILIGKGSVEVIDNQGKLIKADNVIYEKANNFLLVEGSVEFFDTDGNIIITEKATYDKKNEISKKADNC